VNLLLIGDVHNQRIHLEKIIRDRKLECCPSLEQVDLALCTGDFETIEALEDLKSQLKIPFYMVHGNHDGLDIEYHETNLHVKEVNTGRIILRGLGGIPPDFFTCSATWESEEEMYEMWPFITSRGGILLTHVPPFGMLDGTPDGNNYGSRTVRRIMEELQPDFLVCGHVHQSFGKESINGTTVINCGSIQDNPLQILNMDNLNTYRI